MLEHEDAGLIDEAISQAGEIALKFFHSSARKWDKADGTPVTEADMAVDSFLKETLTRARPDYGWLSEETVDNTERLSRKRVWIVDPIDGTRAFVERTDQWCISVGLIENGEPLLGAILRPVTGDVYWGLAGGGASKNGKSIRAGDRDHLEGSKLIAPCRALKPERWSRPWPDLQRTYIASLALRICAVADASVDGTIALKTNAGEWDVAASGLILKEAGGILTTRNGEKISFNQTNPKQTDGLIAGGRSYHRALVEQVKTFVQ